VLLAFTLAIAGLVVTFKRRQAEVEAIRSQERPLALLDAWPGSRCVLQPLEGPARRHRGLVVCLGPHDLSLHQPGREPTVRFRAPYHQLRWFGRPVKYHDGLNEIWLHLETPEGWLLLKLWLDRASMARLVKTLKPLVTPELVTAYRRHRPYIHAGPLTTQPATQNIHGAWSLADPLRLYLMPRLLLMLDEGVITRRIPLEAISQVGALRRLDAPEADGLVRFMVGEEVLAFALPDPITFANQLAEAARLNLEAPILPKQKGKKDEEDEE
jgi:hypothetical protein